MDQRKEKLYIFLFFLTIFFALCSGHLGGDGFWSYLTAKSIVHDGDISLLNVEKSFGVPELESNMEKVYSIAQQNLQEGKKYASKYGILLPLAEVPFYILGLLASKVVTSVPADYFTVFSVSFTNCFITAFLCLYVYMLTQLFVNSKKISFTITMIFAFGTFIFPYALKAGMGEPLLGLSVIGAAFYAIRYKFEGSEKDLIYSGLFAGAAFLTKFYSVLVIGVLFLYVFNEIKKKKSTNLLLFKFIFPIGTCFFIFLCMNYLRYGLFFSTGYPELNLDSSGVSYQIFDYSFIHIIARFYGLLFSSGKGLLFFAPVIILFYTGIKRMFKSFREEAALFLLMFLVPFIFHGLLTIWYGGEWGPRYLVYSVPFIVIPAAFYKLEKPKTPALKYILIFSMMIQLPSVVMNYYQFIRFTDHNKINVYRHFLPQFSPIVGGYMQLFSAVNRSVTGESLRYPAKYIQYSDFIVYSPSIEAIAGEDLSLEGYDNFDLWITNVFKSIEKNVMIKILAIVIYLFNIFLVVSITRRVLFLISHEPSSR